MTNAELANLKDEMTQLMIQVHGAQYTIGWLLQAYKIPSDPQSEEGVVLRTIDSLKATIEQNAISRGGKNVG